MEEYLVESHMGGYYVSCDDYDTITSTCETCGDYDKVISSWSSEEEKYNSILNLILKDYYITYDSLKEYINDLFECYDNKSFSEFLNDFKYLREMQLVSLIIPYQKEVL